MALGFLIVKISAGDDLKKITNTIYLNLSDCLSLEFLKFCGSNLMVEILQILKFIVFLAQIINIYFKKWRKKRKENLCRNCSGSMVFVSSGHLVDVYVL